MCIRDSRDRETERDRDRDRQREADRQQHAEREANKKTRQRMSCTIQKAKDINTIVQRVTLTYASSFY